MSIVTRLGRRVFTLIAAMTAAGACGTGDLRQPPVPGNPAPDFAAVDLSDRLVSLEELRGNVIVLNLWATWCVPCVREMPGLQALQNRYGERGLQVIGVSIDLGSTNEAIRTFLNEHGITYQILHDPDQRVVTAFRTIGVPETFLIGRDGVIAHRWIGEFDPMGAEALERVEGVAAAPTSPR